MGIADHLPNDIASLIAENLKEKSDLKSFIGRTLELETRLRRNSGSFEEFEQDRLPAYSHMDTQLLELLKCCQERVVQRFLENYQESVHVCIKQQSTDGNDLTVGTSTGTFRVSSGRCECREFERTGVACPHLIEVARSHGLGYSALVTSKWQRKL